MEFTNTLDAIIKEEFSRNLLQMDFYMARPKDPILVNKAANKFYPDMAYQ